MTGKSYYQTIQELEKFVAVRNASGKKYAFTSTPNAGQGANVPNPLQGSVNTEQPPATGPSPPRAQGQNQQPIVPVPNQGPTPDVQSQVPGQQLQVTPPTAPEKPDASLDSSSRTPLPSTQPGIEQGQGKSPQYVIDRTKRFPDKPEYFGEQFNIPGEESSLTILPKSYASDVEEYKNEIESIPELDSLYTSLFDKDAPNYEKVNRDLLNRHAKYRNVAQEIYNRGGQIDIEAIRKHDSDLADAMTWLTAVRSGAIDPNADPDTAKKHIKSLWSFGVHNYISNGFTYDPTKSGNWENMKARYMSLYAKALDDKKLTLDDLNIIYNNFTDSLNLNKTSPIVSASFMDWVTSENVNPLYKVGLLLGVPLAAIGLATTLFKGADLGSVLMLLLGGMGAYFGLQSLQQYQLSSQSQAAPQQPVSINISEMGLPQFTAQDLNQMAERAATSTLKAQPGQATWLNTQTVNLTPEAITSALDTVIANPKILSSPEIRTKLIDIARLLNVASSNEIFSQPFRDTLSQYSQALMSTMVKLNNGEIDVGTAFRDIVLITNNLKHLFNTSDEAQGFTLGRMAYAKTE